MLGWLMNLGFAGGTTVVEEIDYVEDWQYAVAPKLVWCVAAPALVNCTTAPKLHGRYKEDDRLILVPELIVQYFVGIFEGF